MQRTAVEKNGVDNNACHSGGFIVCVFHVVGNVSLKAKFRERVVFVWESFQKFYTKRFSCFRQ